MFERFSLMLGRVLTLNAEDLKREEGQGATEYALVVGFIVVAVAVTVGGLGTAIAGLLSRVAGDLNGIWP
jgi:Flp pilus assembly pilin Flp